MDQQPQTPEHDTQHERDRDMFLVSVITAGFSAPTQRWAHVLDFALYLPRFGPKDDIGPSPHGGHNARLSFRDPKTATTYTLGPRDIAAALERIAAAPAGPLGMTEATRATALGWDQYAIGQGIDRNTADQVIQIAALGRVTYR